MAERERGGGRGRDYDRGVFLVALLLSSLQKVFERLPTAGGVAVKLVVAPVAPPGLLVTLEERLLPSEERWREEVGLDPLPAPSPAARP